MSRALPWPKLDAAAKVEAVRPLEAGGDANGTIAFRLKAPRSEVDRICALLRRERHAADVITHTPRGSSGTAREASSTGSGTTAKAPVVGTQSGSPNFSSDTPPSEKGGGDVPNAGVSAVPPDLLAANASSDPATPQPVTAPGRATSSQAARVPQPLTERERTVLRMRQEGLSGGEIAGRLGVSRSAVLGSIRRMKAKGIAVPGSQTVQRKPKDDSQPKTPRTRRPSKALAHLPGGAPRTNQYDLKARAERRATDPGVTITRAAAWSPIEGVEPVGLFDLTSTTCRWPVFDGDDPARFCGAKCPVEHSYCRAHAALSYQPAVHRLRAPRGA